MKKILVLYSELADYVLNSFVYFSENFNAEFHIIHWPINSEAPFVFSANENIKMYNKQSFNKDSLIVFAQNLKADAIICAGWMDNDYINISKKYSKKAPVILTMDNHWEGTIKQYILKLISPLYLKGIFSHIWVPGIPQKTYAKKLGFTDKQILTGFYVANSNIFREIKYTNEKEFIYIGRYIEHKGIKDLWSAFIQLKKEFPNNWKLKCIGTGELWDQRAIDKDIEHIGFIQPNNLAKTIKGGVLVLPSHFEPWGVVVHEFAIAGFPMILSDSIGASKDLLHNNGFLFNSGNIEDLKNQMKKMILLNDQEIILLNKNSKANSNKITNKVWSEQLNELLTKTEV